MTSVAVGGIAEGFSLYWLYVGAWSQLLLRLTCLSFILDPTGLAVVELYGNCIAHKWVFFKKCKKRKILYYVQKLEENKKKIHFLYGFWKLLTLYTTLHYSGFVRNAPFVEIKFLRIMTISKTQFRECHLLGRMSFTK